MTKAIYLDYNASTPIDPTVAAAMQPLLFATFANPTGGHAEGRGAAQVVEEARCQVARFVGARPEHITFTSGATEANNMVLLGVAQARGGQGKHIITTAVEHPSVLNPCSHLRTLGFEVTVLPVDAHGRVSVDAVAQALRPDTILVSVMHANNEVGTVQPVQQIARAVAGSRALLHSDAALSAGKIAVNVEDLPVDFLTLAAHKMYGPKGIGALFVRNVDTIAPLLRGGKQQRGLRAGTESPLLAAGFGAAASLAAQRGAQDAQHAATLRDTLQARLCQALGERVKVHGHPTERLPNTLSISFADCDARALFTNLPHIAASPGGASCSKGGLSPVLAAMGVDPRRGQGVVRFSVGRFSHAAEIDAAVDAIITALQAT